MEHRTIIDDLHVVLHLQLKNQDINAMRLPLHTQELILSQSLGMTAPVSKLLNTLLDEILKLITILNTSISNIKCIVITK